LQKLLSYCNSDDIVVTEDFSSQQSMVLWSRERVRGLSRLPLREQLELRRISQVILIPSLRAQALLVPDVLKDAFHLMIRLTCRLEWPLCVGHELAHTHFFKRGSSGLYRLSRTWEAWDVEDEICEVFAGMWVEEGRNHLEASELLAPIASQGGAIAISWANS